eukprot:TRINITY_DN11312_c0_g1_i2.p2 TRINITY_DN11312_c0_g1~~TRINITY_DN11312_c0_g1_i2.p2  ORF type:complete len:119 (-),score=30.09 TRINITY_DN11312_c0_g1_i2:137-493(-)
MPPEYQEYMERDHTPECLHWYDEEGKSHKYSNVAFVDWRQLEFKYRKDEVLMVAETLSALTDHQKLTTYNERHVTQPGEHYRTHSEIMAQKKNQVEELEDPTPAACSAPSSDAAVIGF